MGEGNTRERSVQQRQRGHNGKRLAPEEIDENEDIH